MLPAHSGIELATLRYIDFNQATLARVQVYLFKSQYLHFNSFFWNSVQNFVFQKCTSQTIGSEGMGMGYKESMGHKGGHMEYLQQ